VTVERVRVGDVLALQRREVEVRLDDEYEEIGVRSFGRGLFHKEPVTGAELGAKRVFRIEPGDLVISNVFAWEGAVALASERERGKIGSHRFMTFVASDPRLHLPWASWFFRSEPGLELIRKASPGSAGRNRTLAIERFEALEIPLPPIDEQREVAARLDRLDLDSVAMGHLNARARQLASAIGESMAFEERDTRRVMLSDVLEPRVASEPVDTDRTYRIAGVRSFGRGLFARANLDGGDTSYKTLNRLHEGDVVMSRLKAWEGALAVVPPEFDSWYLSPEFPTFRISSDEIDRAFLEIVVTASQFWERLRGASHGIGARRERVNAARLLEQSIGLPPLEVQQHIATVVSGLAETGRARARSARRVEALLPAALNEAFAGLS
jgi:hypothetical protein